MKKENIGIYRFKRHDESMVGIYDKSQLSKKEVEKICSSDTSSLMSIKENLKSFSERYFTSYPSFTSRT